jgi:hypothetical protein
MAKVQNPKLFEIALQVGGSHYPEVNPVQLEQFGLAVAKKCADIAEREDHDPAECIRSYFGIK